MPTPSLPAVEKAFLNQEDKHLVHISLLLCLGHAGLITNDHCKAAGCADGKQFLNNRSGHLCVEGWLLVSHPKKAKPHIIVLRGLILFNRISILVFGYGEIGTSNWYFHTTEKCTRVELFRNFKLKASVNFVNVYYCQLFLGCNFWVWKIIGANVEVLSSCILSNSQQ